MISQLDILDAVVFGGNVISDHAAIPFFLHILHYVTVYGVSLQDYFVGVLTGNSLLGLCTEDVQLYSSPHNGGPIGLGTYRYEDTNIRPLGQNCLRSQTGVLTGISQCTHCYRLNTMILQNKKYPPFDYTVDRTCALVCLDTECKRQVLVTQAAIAGRNYSGDGWSSYGTEWQ